MPIRVPYAVSVLAVYLNDRKIKFSRQNVCKNIQLQTCSVIVGPRLVLFSGIPTLRPWHRENHDECVHIMSYKYTKHWSETYNAHYVYYTSVYTYVMRFKLRVVVIFSYYIIYRFYRFNYNDCVQYFFFLN